MCYEQGKGVPKDLGIAKQLYKQAADSYHPSGLNNYAYILLLEVILNHYKHATNYSSQKIYEEAVNHLHVSFALGCTEAAYNLGTVYEMGVDDREVYQIMPDLHSARFYYRKAADKVINYSVY